MTLFAWELQTLLKCRYSFETVLSLFYFKPISYFLGSLFTFNLIFIKWSNFLSGIREEKNNWMSILADQVGEGIEEGCIHEDRSADASWPIILLLGFSQMEWQILLAMSITTVTSTKFVLHIFQNLLLNDFLILYNKIDMNLMLGFQISMARKRVIRVMIYIIWPLIFFSYL